MAFPLSRVNPGRLVHAQRSAGPGRTRSILCRTVLDAGGRGLAIGFGIGVLVVAGTSAASLVVIGVLAIGSALVTWTE